MSNVNSHSLVVIQHNILCNGLFVQLIRNQYCWLWCVFL